MTVLAFLAFWGAAGGSGPEGTVRNHGPGEHRAVSGVSRRRSRAPPGGSRRRPGWEEKKGPLFPAAPFQYQRWIGRGAYLLGWMPVARSATSPTLARRFPTGLRDTPLPAGTSTART